MQQLCGIEKNQIELIESLVYQFVCFHGRGDDEQEAKLDTCAFKSVCDILSYKCHVQQEWRSTTPIIPTLCV